MTVCGSERTPGRTASAPISCTCCLTAHRLSSPPGEELFPRFSPDGSRLAFSANYDGNTPDTVFFASSHVVGTIRVGEWDLFELDNGFFYSGTDNLLVEIVWNGAASGSNVTSRYMSSSPNRRAWEWDWQATTAYRADAYRYNARLGFQDDTNDVLPDIMDIPLNRRKQNPAGRGSFAAILLRFDVWQQPGYRLLHHASRLDHLR